MKKVEIKHLDGAPDYFYDGSVLYKRTESESSNELLIKTEFSIPEVRKLDKGEYVIKSEIITLPLSLRKLFIKYPISDVVPTTSTYIITYEICKEMVDGIRNHFINGELWEK